MKKNIDSDWLRAVQFKCNTSAKIVTPLHITLYCGRQGGLMVSALDSGASGQRVQAVAEDIVL